jgi:hypothetical protein
VVVATSHHVLGEAAIAQIRDRTAIAWTEGPTARVVVQGTGKAPVDLVAQGTSAEDLSLVAAGDAFFLLYRHKYGETVEGCDLVGRRVDPDGRVSTPAVLASDVCGQTYPIYRIAVRDRTLFVAHTSGLEGQGVEVVRWSVGGAPVPASQPGDESPTSVRFVAPTADGLVVAWSVALQHEKWVGRRLDPAGRLAGPAEPLRVYEQASLAWNGESLVQYHLHGGLLEARELPWGGSPGRWHTVDVGARTRQASLVRTGGRLWGVFEVATGGVRLLPLAPDATPAGPPTAIGGTLVAIDGAHGATLDVRDREHEIVWQALDCR